MFKKQLSFPKKILLMKRVLLIIFCCGTISGAFAQQAEKCQLGVETLLRLQGEARLKGAFTLRGTLDGQVTEMGYNSLTGFSFALAPRVGLETRWYYNLQRRHALGKPVAQNNGNFIALQHAYTFNRAALHNMEATFFADGYSADRYAVSLVWGLRRNLRERIYFETFAGLGYQRLVNHTNAHPYGHPVVPVLAARFGYLLCR